MKGTVNGISLNYELTGKGKPLSLIHGMGNDLHVWDEVLPSFASRYQVLSYDARGHGLSDKPSGPYSAATFAEDLCGLLTHLGIDRTFLVGFSMGGVIALQFALSYPEMTEALILIGSSSEVNAKASALYQERANQVEIKGMQAASDLVDSLFAPEFVMQNPNAATEYRRRLLRNDPRAYAAAARAMTNYNLTGELKKIECPTLIIVGDKDLSVGVGGSVIIHRNIPGSKLSIVPGVGHIIMWEKPDALANEILGFLTRL